MKTLNTVTTQTRAVKAVARTKKLQVVAYKDERRSLVNVDEQELNQVVVSREGQEMLQFIRGDSNPAAYARCQARWVSDYRYSKAAVYEEYCNYPVPLSLADTIEYEDYFCPDFEAVDLVRGYDILKDLVHSNASWYEVLELIGVGFTYEELIDLDSYALNLRSLRCSNTGKLLTWNSKEKLILCMKILSCLSHAATHTLEIRDAFSRKTVEELETVLEVVDTEDAFPKVNLNLVGLNYLLDAAASFKGFKEHLVVESLYEGSSLTTAEYYSIKALLKEGNRRKLNKVIIEGIFREQPLYALEGLFQAYGLSPHSIEVLSTMYFDLDYVHNFDTLNIKVLNKYLKAFEVDALHGVSALVSIEEVILIIQIFGTEVLKGGIFNKPHDLFNLYQVPVVTLKEPLDQRWNQFFSKNLECAEYASYTHIFKEFPKSKEFFLKVVAESGLEGEFGENAGQAKTLLALGIPKIRLPKAIEATLEYSSKSKDILPEVSIQEGAYSLEKLSVGDISHLWVGIPTDCCQHLEAAGSSCAVDSFTSEYSSTYVLKREGQILAQSWVWIDEEGKSVVIDSIEHKRGLDVSRISSMWLSLARELGKKFKVFIGSTNYGCTNAVVDAWEDLGIIEAFTTNSYVKPTNYTGYLDGREQFPVNL